MAKEVLILTGKGFGADANQLSLITDIDPSNIGRRFDSAKQKIETDAKLRFAKSMVEREYGARIAISQV
jgi:hypothetical protein